eukprot:TRINITY_DN62126_c0_g1_i1.p1 TRINITY_DN62126_c0_g1~~TRINITY_DN62126_c0_g1_i1.p1  ORF type:complete len:243 (-),score=27.30 TRINITY_DN62126_c0_g1_i1:191-919(-)
MDQLAEYRAKHRQQYLDRQQQEESSQLKQEIAGQPARGKDENDAEALHTVHSVEFLACSASRSTSTGSASPACATSRSSSTCPASPTCSTSSTTSTCSMENTDSVLPFTPKLRTRGSAGLRAASAARAAREAPLPGCNWPGMVGNPGGSLQRSASLQRFSPQSGTRLRPGTPQSSMGTPQSRPGTPQSRPASASSLRHAPSPPGVSPLGLARPPRPPASASRCGSELAPVSHEHMRHVQHCC